MLRQLAICLAITSLIHAATYNDIPKLNPLYPNVSMSTSYTFETLLPISLTPQSYFVLDFSNSNIQAPTANLNCTYLNLTTNTPVLFTNCSCSSNVCILAPAIAFPQTYRLSITMGNLTNPSYVTDQTVTITVAINSSNMANVNSTISSLIYAPNSIIVNGFTQSNYGVGSTNVTYTFNISLGKFIPAQPMLQLVLPKEVSLNATSFFLVFYGQPITSNPTQFSGSLIFYINYTATNTASGYILLKVSGFANPQYIGQSSSFEVGVNTMLCVSGCKVSYVNSGIVASSSTAGNLPVNSLYSNSTTVNSVAQIMVNLQLYAPIPIGGMLQILLPPNVQPALPISCQNINWYLSPNTTQGVCTYDPTSNVISTVNFAYPYLAAPSTAAMSFLVINPADTTPSNFKFQTIDSSGRTIGVSQQGFVYTASPGLINSSASRSSTEVDSTLILYFNLTFNNRILPNGKIQLLIPIEMANISLSPVCKSGLTAFVCSVTTPASNPVVYNLTFVPPCLPNCQAFNFSVSSINNPAYFNPQANPLVVQTVNNDFSGITDSDQITISDIPLTLHNQVIQNVTVVGSGTVGTQQNLTLTFALSPYIQTNGGQILVLLPMNSTFVWSTPYSSTVVSSQTINVTTSYTLYDSNMQSVQQLTLAIDCNLLKCGNQLTITISGITYSYSSSSYSPYSYTIQTKQGYNTTQGTIAYPTSVPKSDYQGVLIQPSVSMTGSTSSYNITFTPTIPIDCLSNGGYIQLVLPVELGVSNSSTCSVITNLFLAFILKCQINQSLVQVYYDVGNPQNFRNLTMSIIINGLTNAATLKPLAYTLTSFFNNAPSQIFSATYSLTQPSLTTLVPTKTNNTYNMPSNLTLSIGFQFSLTASDVVSIQIPQDMFVFTNNCIIVNNVSTNISMFSNGGLQTITFVAGVSQSNLTLVLGIVNPSSTRSFGVVSVNISRGGYSSQTSTAPMPQCVPMTLNVSANTTSLQTGDNVNVTFAFSANPNSKSLKISLPNTAWIYTTALLQGISLVNNSLLPLNQSNTVLVLSSLNNRVSIFPMSETIVLTLFDQSNNPVQISYFPASLLCANVPKPIQTTGYRSNSISSAAINLTLSVQGLVYQTNLSTLSLQLSQYQFIVSNGVSCTFVNISTPCSVLASSNNTLILNYPCETMLCNILSFKVIIAGVSNLYSDQGPLNVTILNNGYLSEASSTVVTPPITSAKLNNVVVTITNKTISTADVLSVSFQSRLVITHTSSVSVAIQDLIFVKGSNCTYTIGPTQYSGCNFNISSSGYVTQIQLGTLGQSDVQPNTTISLSLNLTNSYSSRDITLSVLRVMVSYNTILISGYSTTLGSVLNGTGFLPVSLVSVIVQRSSSSSRETTNFQIQAAVPVSFVSSSTFLVSLPKDQVSIPSSHILTCSSCNSTYLSEDSQYYYYSIRQTSCQTNICPSQTVQFSISGLSNSDYSQTQRNPIKVQLTLGQDIVSTPFLVNLAQLTPSQANVTMSRSNTGALLDTNITLQIGVPQALPPNFLIKLTPRYIVFQKGVSNAYILDINSSVTFTNTLQGDSLTNCVINVSTSLTSFTIVLSVVNAPLVAINGSLVDVYIYSNNIVFYQNNLVQILNPIVPYYQNVTLTNSNPVVGQTYSLIIAGQLPLSIVEGYTLQLNTSKGSCTNCIQSSTTKFNLTSNSFSFTLSNLTNPPNLVPIVYTISVYSTTYVAFSSQVQVLPKVAPITFTSFYTLTSQVVSTASNLSIQLINSNANTINVTLPKNLLTSVKSCYLNGITLSNWTVNTSSSTGYQVNIAGVGLINGGSLTLEIMTSPYAISVSDYLNLSLQPPLAVTRIPFNITLIPKPISVSFTSTSLSVSTVANYSLYLTLSKFAQNTHLYISLPFSATQVSSSSNPSLSIANNSLTISNFSTQQTITFVGVTNPPDDRTMTVLIQQISNQSLLTMAQNQTTYKMTSLAPILLEATVRNTSHYNSEAEVNISLVIGVNGTTLKVGLPINQVYLYGNVTCYLASLTVLLETNCSANGNNIQVANPSGWKGENTLVIHGYNNVNYNKILGDSNSLNLSLLDLEGYTCAQLYAVSFLSPEASTGMVAISSYTSTSLEKLTPTNVSFNFALQDALSQNSSLVLESNRSYVQTQTLACTISGTSVPCSSYGNRTQILLVSIPNTTNGSVFIHGLSVGVLANPIQIYTFDNDNNGYIDSIAFGNPFAYSILVLKIRVIFPVHTVGTHNLTIVVDTNLPVLTDNSYCLNISVPGSDSSASNINIGQTVLPFTQSVCLNSSFVREIQFSNVKFTQPSTSQITVALQTDNIQIAYGEQKVEILPQQHGFCSNPDCDSCSTYSGGQYCFSCREGMVSDNGKCSQSCPSTWFSLNGICQECSFNCNDCFGQTQSQCLSCKDPLIDDSGKCTTECTNGQIKDGYCLSNDICSLGCQKCSPTGFCYSCSKNYEGIGTCTYTNPLPTTLFSYMVVAPAVGYIGLSVYGLVLCQGLESLIGSSIMSLSIVELFCNVLMIPLESTLFLTSWLTVFLVFKVVSAIAIYESHFKSSINKQEELIQKPLTHKDKFIMFMAHFIGVDAYQFYWSKTGSPTYKTQHFGKPMRLFVVISMVPRALLFFTCAYTLSRLGVGDKVLLPSVCMVSQVLITLGYIGLNPAVKSRMGVCLRKANVEPLD